MKYIVMECHKGYAVLMDEEARFVNAADLNYEVGQSVTDPIIMNEGHRTGKITFTAGKFIAAAACLVLFASAGALYYSHNMKAQSTVVISSEVDIRMYANKKGRIIRIVSDSPSGKELLKDYSGKGKDKLTVANEIIGLEREKGYISTGDTIDLYVSSEDSTGYETFRSDLESSMSDINVSVHGIGDPDKPAKPEDGAKKPDPPKPDKDNTPEKPAPDKEKPVQPPPPAKTEPPAPGTPPDPKVEPPKADGKADVPAPPLPPADPKAPGEPEVPAKPDKPTPPGKAEPPQPEHELHEKLSGEIEINKQHTLEDIRPAALKPKPGDNDEAADENIPSSGTEHDMPQPPAAS